MILSSDKRMSETRKPIGRFQRAEGPAGAYVARRPHRNTLEGGGNQTVSKCDGVLPDISSQSFGFPPVSGFADGACEAGKIPLTARKIGRKRSAFAALWKKSIKN